MSNPIEAAKAAAQATTAAPASNPLAAAQAAKAKAEAAKADATDVPFGFEDEKAPPVVRTRRTPAQVQADLKAEADAKAASAAKAKAEAKAEAESKGTGIPEGYGRLYNRGKCTYTLPNGDKSVKCVPRRAIILPTASVDKWVKVYPEDLVRFEDQGKSETSKESEEDPREAEITALKAELEALKTENAALKV